MASDKWVLVGNGSLLAGCGDVLLSQGQEIAAVVTSEPEIEQWATRHGIHLEPSDTKLPVLLREVEFDHLASIAHLSIIPADALRLVRGVALNFHDGPLPELAGLNVTTWAILRGERTHGVTWHLMTERADEGRILVERRFDIAPDETAFLLNAKCYAAGLESFGDVARRVAAADLNGREQDLTGRSYFGRWARPDASAAIDWQSAAEDISALVRGLDFGAQANPLTVAKLFLGDTFLAVGQAAISDHTSGLAAGTVVLAEQGQVQVATTSADIVLTNLTELDGSPVVFDDIVRRYGLGIGVSLPALTPPAAKRLTDVSALAARSEHTWLSTLTMLAFPDLDIPKGRVPSARHTTAVSPSVLDRVSASRRLESVLAAIALLAARRSGASTVDIAYSDTTLASRVADTFGAFSSRVPLRMTIDRAAPFAAAVAAVATAREDLLKRGPLAVDLWARQPALRAANRGSSLDEATVSIGVGVEAPPARVRCTVSDDGSQCRITSAAEGLAAQLEAVILNVLAQPNRPVAQIDLMTADAQAAALRAWNDTDRPVPEACIHELFEDQATRTPDAVALIYRGQRMSYRELDRADEPARAPSAQSGRHSRRVGRHLPAPLLLDGRSGAGHAQGGRRVPAARSDLSGGSHRVHGRGCRSSASS